MTLSGLRIYAALAVLVFAACAPKPSGPQPPEIIYGQDVCDKCGMIIDDVGSAAATLLTNGNSLKFDDIGEMLAYHMEHPEAQVQAWFVHDHDTEKWIRGEGAFFVKGDVKTPMGGAIAAFVERTAADSFAGQVNGKVYSLDELRVEVHLTVHGG